MITKFRSIVFIFVICFVCVSFCQETTLPSYACGCDPIGGFCEDNSASPDKGNCTCYEGFDVNTNCSLRWREVMNAEYLALNIALAVIWGIGFFYAIFLLVILLRNKAFSMETVFIFFFFFGIRTWLSFFFFFSLKVQVFSFGLVTIGLGALFNCAYGIWIAAYGPGRAARDFLVQTVALSYIYNILYYMAQPLIFVSFWAILFQLLVVVKTMKSVKFINRMDLNLNVVKIVTFIISVSLLVVILILSCLLAAFPSAAYPSQWMIIDNLIKGFTYAYVFVGCIVAIVLCVQIIRAFCESKKLTLDYQSVNYTRSRASRTVSLFFFSFVFEVVILFFFLLGKNFATQLPDFSAQSVFIFDAFYFGFLTLIGLTIFVTFSSMMWNWAIYQGENISRKERLTVSVLRLPDPSRTRRSSSDVKSTSALDRIDRSKGSRSNSKNSSGIVSEEAEVI